MATQKSPSQSTSPVSAPAAADATTPQGVPAADPGSAEEATGNPEEPIEYSTEQMVGHLLQHVDALENRVYRLEHPTAAAPARPTVRPARK